MAPGTVRSWTSSSIGHSRHFRDARDATPKCIPERQRAICLAAVANLVRARGG
jgi:hypothetical protein